MDFCDILQKQRNSILIRFASRWLDRASGWSLLKSFPCSNKNLELSELLDIVQTCCWVVRGACWDWTSSGCVALSSGRIVETSQTVLTSENRLLVEYWLIERPDSVALTSERLSCLSVRHYGAYKHLQRPVWTVAQELTNLSWFLQRTLHGYLLEACKQ